MKEEGARGNTDIQEDQGHPRENNEKDNMDTDSAASKNTHVHTLAVTTSRRYKRWVIGGGET